MLLAVSIVHTVADSFTMPGNQVAAALASPPEHLSSAQGLLGATGLAAAGLTGLVAGFVYEYAGRFVVCTGTAAIMTCFLLVAVTLGRARPRRHAGDAGRCPDAGRSRRQRCARSSLAEGLHRLVARSVRCTSPEEIGVSGPPSSPSPSSPSPSSPVDFFAVAFFAVDFFAVAFFAVDFFAVAFFAVAFFAVDFFAVDFFTGARLVAWPTRVSSCSMSSFKSAICLRSSRSTVPIRRSVAASARSASALVRCSSWRTCSSLARASRSEALLTRSVIWSIASNAWLSPVMLSPGSGSLHTLETLRGPHQVRKSLPPHAGCNPPRP